ncbi:sensor histidine kinase [Paeniglutamicibacter sp. NPDC091659]|uniref:sensor histidine kinase n=1 Tax=Paeniglutamicibacter sp. NPDC091659 TaxID=3364389 RepID=UPI00381C7851
MLATTFLRSPGRSTSWGRIQLEDLTPALSYAGLTWLLHALALAGSNTWGLRDYAQWWPVPLAIGCLAIFLRRRHVPLFAAIIAVSGIALLLVGSIGGFFLLFEAVFTLVLLAGPRLSRIAEHGALVLTGLLVVVMYFVTGSAAISVTLGLVVGMTLLMPAEWAGNVRKSRELVASEAQTAAAVAEAAAARAKVQAAEHDLALAAERTTMAREVHDALSARLAAIALQSGAALNAPHDKVLNARAMSEIRVQSVKGIEELNTMIRMLHLGTPLAPTETLADVPALIATYTGTGLRVKYLNELADAGSGLPAVLQAALYRAVNESLTNFAKHAPQGELELLLAMHGQSVQFTSANPLGNRTGSEVEPAAQPTTGTGLRGLHARSRELGGSFQAGVKAGRFALNMLLPLGNP